MSKELAEKYISSKIKIKELEKQLKAERDKFATLQGELERSVSKDRPTRIFPIAGSRSMVVKRIESEGQDWVEIDIADNE